MCFVLQNSTSYLLQCKNVQYQLLNLLAFLHREANKVIITMQMQLYHYHMPPDDKAPPPSLMTITRNKCISLTHQYKNALFWFKCSCHTTIPKTGESMLLIMSIFMVISPISFWTTLPQTWSTSYHKFVPLTTTWTETSMHDIFDGYANNTIQPQKSTKSSKVSNDLPLANLDVAITKEKNSSVDPPHIKQWSQNELCMAVDSVGSINWSLQNCH